MFFISALVPNGSVSLFLIDTFASHLMLPSSILQSLISEYSKSSRNFSIYNLASTLEEIQGLVTISISGTPALLKSSKVTLPL